MFDFEKLKCYKKALAFSNWVYEITKEFPKDEQFGVISQFRRAALSIPLNIAEGVGRYNKKDRQHFYRMARSSSFECIPLIEISLQQQYIDNSIYVEARSKCEELSKIIMGLIKALHTNTVIQEKEKYIS